MRRILGALTVHENLLLACSARRGRGDAAIRQVYEQFPVLAQRRDQQGGTLSGGEQQMLAIGRALVADARLLMMDEPSLGLAPLMVREVFGVIERLKNDGRTILLVEQNARAALKIADRAYVIETGRIKNVGVPADLLSGGDVLSAYLGVASNSSVADAANVDAHMSPCPDTTRRNTHALGWT
jgi:branched-chain amino acid transport system ATP-binding protein